MGTGELMGHLELMVFIAKTHGQIIQTKTMWFHFTLIKIIQSMIRLKRFRDQLLNFFLNERMILYYGKATRIDIVLACINRLVR